MIEISNKNLLKKYYEIMKNYKKFLGMPKMCSNHTLKFENTTKIENSTRNRPAFNFQCIF